MRGPDLGGLVAQEEVAVVDLDGADELRLAHLRPLEPELGIVVVGCCRCLRVEDAVGVVLEAVGGAAGGRLLRVGVGVGGGEVGGGEGDRGGARGC